MAITFERLDGESILIATITPPLLPESETQRILAELGQFMAETDGDVVYINDMSGVSAMQFADVVLGAANLTRTPGTPFVDPRFKIIMVGTHEMVKLASESLKQEQYGQIYSQIYPTRDEAISAARALLNGGA